jgi:AAA domain/UvrD-like helicase C-terminal domain
MQQTPEQQAIIGYADSPASLMIEALAGTGKSTTLRMLCRAMRQQPCRRTLALAFNVRNKKDMEGLLPDWVTVKTMNGLGHAAWQWAMGRRLQLDERKLGRLTTAELRRQQALRDEDDWSIVRDLAAAAMAAGLVPRGFDRRGLVADSHDEWAGLADSAVEDRHIELAKAVLVASIRESFAGTISFDDQLYMPLFFDGRWEQYQQVLVDEAQDLNELNHLQVKRVLQTDGRLIVVGDSRQAINQFRGAHSRSMAMLRKLRPAEQWVDLTLSVTFRCPKAMVAAVQDHAPGFTAAATNAEGQIVQLEPGQSWNWQELVWQHGAGCGSLAVICRNNAPLVSLAFKLLRNGISCHMLGRDIGKGLAALAKKLCKETMTPAECIVAIRAWERQERALLTANEGSDAKLEVLTDKAECLVAIAEADGVTDGKSLRAHIDKLFAASSGQVTLASGHRSKGLEWDLVLHLDPWRLPSKMAKKALAAGDPTQMEQERNLGYVITTRAKKVLVMASLDDWRTDE